MYKLRDGVELPKTFKMKVTPEQSEVVQKHLFSKGVAWASGHKEVRYITNPFLFVSENTLLCATTLDFFTDYVSPEIRFSDYFEPVNSATDIVLKFLQKHHTKISTDVYRPCGGTRLDIKAEVVENGVAIVFDVSLFHNEMGKANTFISNVSAVLGLNPVGLKAHELERENTTLRPDLETARNFARDFYKRRLSELRKELYEIKMRTKELITKPKVKWCVKVSPKNKAQLNAYLQKNSSKYEGFNEKWAVETDGIYFYSESPASGFHSSQNLYPGFVLIKNKNLKHYI